MHSNGSTVNHVEDGGPATQNSSKKNNSAGLKADRTGVSQAFTQFGQLIHASRRPLPTQMGDGTYNEKKKKTGLRNDIKYLKWKGNILISSPRDSKLTSHVVQMSRLSSRLFDLRSRDNRSLMTRL
jgi:hypothetical protein